MASVINLKHEPALKLALTHYPRHAGTWKGRFEVTIVAPFS